MPCPALASAREAHDDAGPHRSRSDRGWLRGHGGRSSSHAPSTKASTRSPSIRWAGGSAARRVGPWRHDRIEEHGLHLWMGFYENAFRLMRECYAEAGRDPASAASPTGATPSSRTTSTRSPTDRRAADGCPGRCTFRPCRAARRSAAERRPWTVADYVGRIVMLRGRCSRRSSSAGGQPPTAARAGGAVVTTPTP